MSPESPLRDALTETLNEHANIARHEWYDANAATDAILDLLRERRTETLEALGGQQIVKPPATRDDDPLQASNHWLTIDGITYGVAWVFREST